MPAIAASLPMSSQLGEIAVLKISAASRNSRTTLSQRPKRKRIASFLTSRSAPNSARRSDERLEYREDHDQRRRALGDRGDVYGDGANNPLERLRDAFLYAARSSGLVFDTVAAVRIIMALTLLLISSLALSQVTAPKLLESTITYSSGRLRIKAFTVRPDVTERLPAVMLNHGGTDGVTWATKQRARDLARAGFAVFASAYRGEDNSDGQIEIAAGEVDDVLEGMKWFSKQPFVDTNRIGMLGSSHGALIGLHAAARSSQVKALVFAYGVADIYAWYAYLVDSKQLGADALTRRIYGNGPQDKPQNFLQRHGLRVVPQLQSTMPILIQQGELDVIVPPAQARALADELTRFKKPFALEVYPNSAHGFVTAREAVIKRYGADSVQAGESRQAWRQIVAFLTRTLEPRR